MSPPTVPPRGGWLPIASAPKDGTPVLGYHPATGGTERPEFFAVTWFAPSLTGRKEWLIYDGNYKGHRFGPFFSWSPTHWQPLPARPGDEPDVSPYLRNQTRERVEAERDIAVEALRVISEGTGERYALAVAALAKIAALRGQDTPR